MRLWQSWSRPSSRRRAFSARRRATWSGAESAWPCSERAVRQSRRRSVRWSRLLHYDRAQRILIDRQIRAAGRKIIELEQIRDHVGVLFLLHAAGIVLRHRVADDVEHFPQRLTSEAGVEKIVGEAIRRVAAGALGPIQRLAAIGLRSTVDACLYRFRWSLGAEAGEQQARPRPECQAPGFHFFFSIVIAAIAGPLPCSSASPAG